MGRFINPFTDFGFKYLFGREVSKDILIEFLNDLLQGERVITDLRFLNNEQEPEQKELRKVIYDIYCETNTGEWETPQGCSIDRLGNRRNILRQVTSDIHRTSLFHQR